MKDHLTPETLESWLRGDLPPAAVKPLVAHLVRGCVECSRAIREGVLLAAPVDPSFYDMPVRRVFRRVLRGVREEEREQERASGDLVALLRTGAPPSKRSPAERAGAAGWRWCEDFLEASRELLRENSQGAVYLAVLAVSVAEQLEPGRFPAGRLADLRARARAELGNARRAADDLANAESDLAAALTLTQQGTGAPLLRARILDLCASLLRDQRQLDEAERCLKRVYALYRKHGKPHLAGRALIKMGLVAGERLDYMEAIESLEQGLGMIDRAGDMRLTFVAVHGIIDFMVKAGHLEQARQLLETSRPLYLDQAGDVDRVKVRWVEGKIAYGLGELDDAELSFTEARGSFAKLGKVGDVALVTLDLAAVYLRQGRPAEVGRLASEMLTTFRALGIRREALAAVILFEEAARTERLTLALLEDLAREFRRLEA